MALKHRHFAAATAFAAALSVSAIPAAAVEQPRGAVTPATVYDAAVENAANHGWYGRNRGVDVGDVITGVVVLGTIAAIANAASRSRAERYPNRYLYPDRDNPQYRFPQRDRYDSPGIENAVDMCVDAVQRGRNQVGAVDSAIRSADGWHVRGSLESGAGFACHIGNDGRISDVDIAGYTPQARSSGDAYDYRAGSTAAGAGQWDDETYARARREGGTAAPRRDYRNEPAYPGGPLPDEELEDGV